MPVAALVTLGCPKNEADSDAFAGVLASAGWEITDDVHSAHLLLLNTCAFISPAVDESVDAIAQAIEWKNRISGRCLILAGCLPGRFSDDGSGGLEDFDLVLGPGETGSLSRFLSSSGEPLPLPSTSSIWRYLKISEGCSNNCSYCTIPLIRGAYEGRDIALIEREAGILVDQGAKEIGLVGQDTGSFLGDGTGVAGLLSRLARSYPRTWFRLYYVHPAHFPEGLLNLMEEHDNIMPYLDIPVQHVSDTVLQRMGRPYGGDTLRELFSTFDRCGSQVSARVTVIVGYPGESEEDFHLLTGFLNEYRCIRNIAAFPYWHEEGTREYHRTPSSELTGDHVVQSRLMRLGEVSEEVHSRWAGYMDGRIIQVLSDDDLTGHSRFDAPVVDGTCVFSAPVKSGSVYRCRVTGSTGPDMEVEVVD